jgi:predicted NAD/FAD-binding protein
MEKRKRICIVGSGAAGSTCAWLLGKYPDKFDVEIWEKCSVPGGVATSVKVGDEGLYINDGVQGGATSYRNTIQLHKVYKNLISMILCSERLVFKKNMSF